VLFLTPTRLVVIELAIVATHELIMSLAICAILELITAEESII
jgi:hypothetical protein